MDWQEFRACLQQRAEPPSLWWRDDDAVSDTPELRDYLQNLRGFPLLLAVISDLYEASLVELVRANPQVSVAQHGFRHVNHVAMGEGKKSEYPASRDPTIIRQEFHDGRIAMQADFASQYSGVFVPPWNRMGGFCLPLLIEEGFAGISMYGQEQPQRTPLCRYDTQVDLIDWSARRFWGRELVLESLASIIKRTGNPIGILTHHRVHCDDCDSFLLDFTGFLQDNSDIISIISPPF